MISTQGRDSFFKRTLDYQLLENKEVPLVHENIELTLLESTRAILLKHKARLASQSPTLSWSHLEAKDSSACFPIEALIKQFDVVDKALTEVYVEDKSTEHHFIASKERDELKIALEQYKLAIMEAALCSLSPPEDETPDSPPPSIFIRGLYGFILIGGTWVAFLHGYDAAAAVSVMLPAAMQSAAFWSIGTVLFLTALGVFVAFEAEEARKSLGFKSTKNLNTTLDINQRQIELTHEFAKQVAIHGEHKKIADVQHYKAYHNLVLRFDHSIRRVKEQVSSLTLSNSRKIFKSLLLGFGMVFSMSEMVFLAVGFGVLTLTAPWSWIAMGLTALVGAAIFYVGFNSMIRDKVAPSLQLKENILEKHALYEKDELLTGIKARLKEKKQLASFESQTSYWMDELKDREQDIKASEINVQRLEDDISQLKKTNQDFSTENVNLKVKEAEMKKQLTLITDASAFVKISDELKLFKTRYNQLERELLKEKKGSLEKDLTISQKATELNSLKAKLSQSGSSFLQDRQSIKNAQASYFNSGPAQSTIKEQGAEVGSQDIRQNYF